MLRETSMTAMRKYINVTSFLTETNYININNDLTFSYYGNNNQIISEKIPNIKDIIDSSLRFFL